jgi:hypothetical protein
VAPADTCYAVEMVTRVQAQVRLPTVDAGQAHSRVLVEKKSSLLQPRGSGCATSSLKTPQYLTSIHILLEAPVFSDSSRILTSVSNRLGECITTPDLAEQRRI